ncbi:MAG TPA: flagellar assembly protein FliH, partial [Rhodanobacteraceae bacterium]|nr:flagellar assembly protein FliH [Rhodanobacteraceae bacterium]
RTLRQLEDVEQRAREDGYAAGLAEGRAAGRAQVAAEVARIHAIAEALAAPFANLDAAVESELVLLATTAATRIVRHELAIAPERIVGAVRDALNVLPASARNVKLFLAPDDAALVREHLVSGASGHAWDIVEDQSLTRGGCRVLADTSQVDATLETRIATIIDAMLGGEDTAR